MAFSKKISSLKDKALYHVAVNLCQDYNFKKVALCLEKPSYGNSICENPSCDTLLKPRYIRNIKDWKAALEKQCERLTEGLSCFSKNDISIWINRIALEYLSYGRRQELLFGVPRNFFLKFLVQSDWTETGRLDEKKLAERLLKDEQLPILQRYRIACVYCLRRNISELWSRLSEEEKHSISGNDSPSHSQEKNRLVLLWSYYLDRCRDELVTQQKNHLWAYAAQEAVHHGNQAALMLCWKRLDEHTQTHMVIDLALQSLEKWKSVKNSCRWTKCLVSDKYCSSSKLSKSIENFNLPNYYSEIVLFFLSEMDKEQQLTFFTQALQKEGKTQEIMKCYSVLQCFLDWPLQDYFLLTMNLLWGIMPRKIYLECLLSIAKKYTGDYDRCYLDIMPYYDKENNQYDYLNLLWNVWEETPLEFKQHVFYDKKFSDSSCTRALIEKLLGQFFSKCPIKEKEVSLFKQIWMDLPQEQKIINLHSITGETTCRILLREERYFFVNWMLENSLPDVEISSFKKDLISSMHGECFWEIKEDRQKYVEDLIDWAFESDTEKKQFRYDIFNYRNFGLESCNSLLCNGEFTKVENLINFCLPSDEVKQQFKDDVGRKACLSLLKHYAWKLMDKILTWSLEAEDKRRNFKSEMFHNENFGLESCSSFLVNGEIAKAENMINFCLSSDEVKQQFKENIGKRVYPPLLKKYAWHELDNIFRWIFGAKNKIRDFKKRLFFRVGLDIHYELVFIKKNWETVESFYRFFSLSPEEIVKIKKETVFMTKVIYSVLTALNEHTNKYMSQIIGPLCWCLTDEEMIYIFRKEIEFQSIKMISKCPIKIAKKRLDYLVSNAIFATKRDIVYGETLKRIYFS